MTSDEFLAAIEQLDWKQSDFCRKAGVTKNTPQRWLAGVTPIPTWAEKFLEMALEIKRLSGLIDPKTK